MAWPGLAGGWLTLAPIASREHCVFNVGENANGWETMAGSQTEFGQGSPGFSDLAETWRSRMVEEGPCANNLAALAPGPAPSVQA